MKTLKDVTKGLVAIAGLLVIVSLFVGNELAGVSCGNLFAQNQKPFFVLVLACVLIAATIFGDEWYGLPSITASVLILFFGGKLLKINFGDAKSLVEGGVKFFNVSKLIAFIASILYFLADMFYMTKDPTAKKAKHLEDEDDVNYMYADGYNELFKHIMLSLFTFGIWTLIWVYKTTSYLNYVKNAKHRNPLLNAVLCILFPYYIYWTYETVRITDKYAHDEGIVSELTSTGVMLAIFQPLMSPVFIQQKLNAIIRKRYMIFKKQSQPAKEVEDHKVDGKEFAEVAAKSEKTEVKPMVKPEVKPEIKVEKTPEVPVAKVEPIVAEIKANEAKAETTQIEEPKKKKKSLREMIAVPLAAPKKPVVVDELAGGKWKCVKCGIINAPYIGTCSCGGTKDEAEAAQRAKEAPVVKPTETVKPVETPVAPVVTPVAKPVETAPVTPVASAIEVPDELKAFIKPTETVKPVETPIAPVVKPVETPITPAAPKSVVSNGIVQPTDGSWICVKCNRKNAAYIGTCACGGTKDEALFPGKPKEAPAAAPINPVFVRRASEQPVETPVTPVVKPIETPVTPVVKTVETPVAPTVKPVEKIVQPTDGSWICIMCKRKNAAYIGTCACGGTKDEALFPGKPKEAPAAAPINPVFVKKAGVPVEQPVVKPVEQPVVTPVAKPVEQPVVKPVEAVPVTPEVKPVEKPVVKPAEVKEEKKEEKKIPDIGSGSIADKLLQYKRLMDNGIITAEDFEAYKNKLLNQ